MSIDDPEMRANICLGIMALLQEFYSGDPPVGGTETSMDILIDNTLSLLGKVTTNPKTYAVLALLSIPAARRNIGTSLLTAIANSDLTEYLLTGQSDIDKFLAEHDFKTEEDIANFLKEHTEWKAGIFGPGCIASLPLRYPCKTTQLEKMPWYICARSSMHSCT